jgi:hypothetical protein
MSGGKSKDKNDPVRSPSSESGELGELEKSIGCKSIIKQWVSLVEQN